MTISDPPHWKEPLYSGKVGSPKFDKIVEMIAQSNIHASRHEPGGGDAMTVDAAVGVGSLRTLGTGALQAAVGNHSHAGELNGTYYLFISPPAWGFIRDDVDETADDKSYPYMRDPSSDYFNHWRSHRGSGSVGPSFEGRGAVVDISGRIPKKSDKTVTITQVNIRARNSGAGSGEQVLMVYQDWDVADPESSTPTLANSDTIIGGSWETISLATDVIITDDRMVWILFNPATGWTQWAGIEVTYTIS